MRYPDQDLAAGRLSPTDRPHGVDARTDEEPPAFPAGWFALCRSDEIETGAMRGMRCFARDLVLWRGMDGRARMLDSRCPHARVDMANGGTVHGNWLQCPLHSWQWDETGAVKCIPYSQAPIRQRSGVLAPKWPLRETGGLLMVWHHLDGAAPPGDPSGALHRRGDAGPSALSQAWRIEATSQMMVAALEEVMLAGERIGGFSLMCHDAGQAQLMGGAASDRDAWLYWTPIEHNRLQLRLQISLPDAGAITVPATLEDQVRRDLSTQMRRSQSLRQRSGLADQP